MAELGLDESLLNILFNSILVISILGLWGLWFHQHRQRKNVEHMLQLASADLQEATKLLEQVMTQLPRMDLMERQADEQPRQTVEHVRRPKEKDLSPQVSNTTSHQDQLYIQQNIQKLKAKVPVQKQQPASQAPADNLSAQIMKLNSEGLSKENIAKHLQIPVAQVRLMLLLQTSKT
ncbi:MAG: hypothetical protein R8M14_00675 [Ghiorsea sp.]